MEKHNSKAKFTEHLTENLNLTPAERKFNSLLKNRQEMGKDKLF